MCYHEHDSVHVCVCDVCVCVRYDVCVDDGCIVCACNDASVSGRREYCYDVRYMTGM